MSILLKELLSVCIDGVSRAAEVISKIHKGKSLGVEIKSDSSPVTVADVESEKIIKLVIRKIWPDIKIVGEENTTPVEWNSSFAPPNLGFVENEKLNAIPSLSFADIVLFIDPLDGTSCFVEGNLASVLILLGITYKGRPIAGIACYPFVPDPSTNKARIVWGALRVGLFGFDKIPPPEDKFLLGVTNHPHKYRTEEYIQKFPPSTVVHMGGAGAKLLALIRGDFHVMLETPFHPCSRWDICACEALLLASGGVLTDIFGNFYDYSVTTATSQNNDKGVLAYYPEYAATYVQQFWNKVK